VPFRRKRFVRNTHLLLNNPSKNSSARGSSLTI
jgi:hypothetical protein